MAEERVNCDLLREIARQPDQVSNRRIIDLAAKIRDWDALLQIGEKHYVLSLLSKRLAQVGTAVPPEARDRLQAAYEHNYVQCMANAAELIAVLRALDGEAIAAIPFKGVVLAVSAYGDLAARPAGDLDILIRFEDRTRATAVLLARGYELHTAIRPDGDPAAPNTFEYELVRPGDGRLTELRWRFDLAHPQFKRELEMDWALPHRQTTVLAGARVPNLDPELTLLTLCLHGSKHRWSRLIWICDVAQLLASSPGLNWEFVLREARRTGLWRSVALGVLLAHRVAHADIPSFVLQRFESIGKVRKLAQYIDENLFDAPGWTPPGLLPYTVQLLSFRDRIGFLLSPSLLQPNERDYAILKLPRRLRGLYYLLRPFRILFDRSPR